MAIAGVFPAVARDLEGAPDPTGREDDGFGAEDLETTAFTIVAKGTHHPTISSQQRQDGVLHMDVDALVHAVVLQGADHFQAGAIADVREARIFMTTKISLQNAAVFRPIEDRAPSL